VLVVQVSVEAELLKLTTIIMLCCLNENAITAFVTVLLLLIAWNLLNPVAVNTDRPIYLEYLK
jgi:hypothetical protein